MKQAKVNGNGNGLVQLLARLPQSGEISRSDLVQLSEHEQAWRMPVSLIGSDGSDLKIPALVAANFVSYLDNRGVSEKLKTIRVEREDLREVAA